eukprot:Lankesteria_metandrocarpae@DN3063_c0_g1_i2.p2
MTFAATAGSSRSSAATTGSSRSSAATAGSSRSSAATAASSNGSICSPIVGGVGGCSRRRNVTAVKYRTANSRMNTTAGTAISTAAKLLNSIQHIHVLQTQQQICNLSTTCTKSNEQTQQQICNLSTTCTKSNEQTTPSFLVNQHANSSDTHRMPPPVQTQNTTTGTPKYSSAHSSNLRFFSPSHHFLSFNGDTNSRRLLSSDTTGSSTGS